MSVTNSTSPPSSSSNVITLVWGNYEQRKIIENIGFARPDVIFLCKNNVKLSAHKAVLNLASEYFDQQITPQTKNQDVSMSMPMVPASILYDILNCLYQGGVTVQQDHVDAIHSVVINLGITGITSLPLPKSSSEKNPLHLPPNEEMPIRETPPLTPTLSPNMYTQKNDISADVASSSFGAVDLSCPLKSLSCSFPIDLSCSRKFLSYPSHRFSAHHANPEPVVINLTDDGDEIDPGTEPVPSLLDLTSNPVLDSKQREDGEQRKTEEEPAHGDVSTLGTAGFVSSAETATSETIVGNGATTNPQVSPAYNYLLNLYECQICHVVFVSQESLELHMSNDHFGQKLQTAASYAQILHSCKFCELKFNKIVDLKNHFQHFHSGKKTKEGPKYVCRFCNMPYYSKQCLRFHEKNSHLRSQ